MILLFRLETLRSSSSANFLLAVLALAYAALNIVMVALNRLNNNGADCGDPAGSVFEARCGSPTSVWTFHVVEFTATFLFSLVQASALLFAPRQAKTIYGDPGTLRLVLVFAVVVSLVPTLLILFNVDTFEVPFDYPRDPDLRFTPEFAALCGDVSHALREGHS